jgi:uncharacterized protein YecE (DUF72 family)
MNSLNATAKIYIGTAGWSIPPVLGEKFDFEGTHLERYSRLLNCVEINSSFYREHKAETYSKWAQSVPADFRFSVKLLRYFTQEKRLKETGSRLEEILLGFAQLREKWGMLLIQLPPSLEFDQIDTDRFLSAVRQIYLGPIAWEPRNKTWASERALNLLASYQINKVLADPEPCFVSRLRRAKVERTVYYRLHGTPEIYKSRYSPDVIERIATRAKEALQEGKTVWCTFDNTTFGCAAQNALELQEKIRKYLSPFDSTSQPEI